MFFLRYALLSLLSPVHAFRQAKGELRTDSTGHNINKIACPVMASLVSGGFMKPDSTGRVDINETIKGLRATGNSIPGSGFQALGIVGFEYNDVNQVRRFTGPLSTPSNKFLNLFTMNPGDKCSSRRRTIGGYPCNANPQFQNHGYSTKVRDPAGGSASRFNAIFNRWGVLTRIRGVNERVMLIGGMAKILSHVRRFNGDYNGEFSLNKMGWKSGSAMMKYHPNAKTPTPLSQWQALLAWGGFWGAFAHKGNPSYITESELRSFFIDGKFPSNWKMQSWGFKENFEAVIAMKGKGCGDEMIKILEGIMQQAGSNPTEQRLSELFIGTVRGFGSFTDDIYNNKNGMLV